MSVRSSAEDLLQEHRYAEAITAFTDHLEAHPDDTRALLELGICHLLNRSDAQFLAIHERASRAVREASELPAEISRLWAFYRSLVARLGVAAIAVGAAAGCDAAPPQNPAVQADTATAATAPPTAEAAASASEEASAAAGGATPTAAAAPTAPPATGAAGQTTAASPSTATTTVPFAQPPPTTTTPAHRYSGGVYRPPTTKPAHRYSGGVRN